MNIGSFIEFIRESRGFSRKDLSDICSEKTLYRTEYGITIPSTQLLINLSKKLNFDFLNYQLHLGGNSNLNDGLKSKLKQLDKAYQYEEMHFYLASECIDETQLDVNDAQLIMYYRALTYYYYLKDIDLSYQLLKDSLNLSIKEYANISGFHSYLSNTELKSILFQSFILINHDRYQECNGLLKTFVLSDIDYSEYQIDRLNALLKISYNKLLSKYRIDDFDGFEDEIMISISICKAYSNYDNLSKLYWLLAYYYYKVDRVDESHYYCKQFILLCDLYEKDSTKEEFVEAFNIGLEYIHKEKELS